MQTATQRPKRLTVPARAMFEMVERNADVLGVYCDKCRDDMDDYGYTFRAIPEGEKVRCHSCGYEPTTLRYDLYRTKCPAAFDGFGTITVEEQGEWRVVGILPDALTWQLTRYRSGLGGTDPVMEGEERRWRN